MCKQSSERKNNHNSRANMLWGGRFLLLVLLVVVTGCGGGTKTSTDPSKTAPTVTSTTPVSAVGGACSNTLVTATFSKAMKPSSITVTTFTLTGPGSISVAGLVTYDAASNTAIFTPSATLALNTAYTATVTSGALDTFGNALAANLAWSFTTGATVCQPGPPA